MAPAAGDHGDAAMHVARLRDLEGRLLDERDEKAALLAEKQALAARLAKLKEAGESSFIRFTSWIYSLHGTDNRPGLLLHDVPAIMN